MAVKERDQAGLFGGLFVHFGLDLFFNFRVQLRVGFESFLGGVAAPLGCVIPLLFLSPR